MEMMKAKYLVFSFRNSNEAIRFVEYIQRRLHGENVNIAVKGNKVKVILFRGQQDLDILASIVKKEYKDWILSTRKNVNGLYRHSIARLLRSAVLETSIPINSIVDILKLKGFEARIREEYIETTADFDQVLKITELFSKNYKRVLELTGYTPMARRVVAIAMTVCEMDVTLLTEKLIKNGIIFLDSNSGRKSLKMSYKEAISKIVELCEEYGDKNY